MATLNANLCSLDMMVKDHALAVYSSSVLSGKCATPSTLLSFCSKKFRPHLSNKTTVTGNWCTKRYAVLRQSIMRIFCPGSVTVRTSKFGGFFSISEQPHMCQVFGWLPVEVVTIGRYRLWKFVLLTILTCTSSHEGTSVAALHTEWVSNKLTGLLGCTNTLCFLLQPQLPDSAV